MFKIFKKIGNSLLAFSMVGYMFAPLSTVIAVGTNTFKFEVENSEKYTIAAQGTNQIKVVRTENNNNIFIVPKDSTGTAIADATVACGTNYCTFTIADTYTNIKFDFDTSNVDITEGESVINPDTKFTGSREFSIKEPAVEPPPSNTGGPEPGESAFDGHTFLVWSCGNKICYHEFNDFPTNNDPIFILDSSIDADNVQGEHFSTDAETKFFSDPRAFATRKVEIDANTVKIDSLVGPDGIDLMPVPTPTLNNAYVSYGNRAFKVFIYNNKFRAVEMGDLGALNYYPGSWTDKLLLQNAYDISGTTKDKPLVFETMLVEEIVTIRSLEYNDFVIKKIEALDVPKDAVSINVSPDGICTFRFASRFYDKVTFKITDAENKVYYLQINRSAIFVDQSGLNNKGQFNIVSYIYYDRETSYKDYVVTASIKYKDGTTKVVELNNLKRIDDGLGNIAEVYESDEENPARKDWPKGKGLKKAGYGLTLDNPKEIDKVYLNVEFKGSTSSNYAGTFAGSGKGKVINVSKMMEGR